MKICPVCSLANPDEFNYCQACPTELVPGKRPSSFAWSENWKEARTPVLILSGVIVVVVALGVGAIVRPRRDLPRSEPSKIAPVVVTEPVMVPSTFRSLADPEKAARGKALFEQMPKVSALRNPGVRGQMTSVASLGLYVKDASWKRLSASERIDLSHYVQSMIAVARSSPRQYVSIPTSAPLYGRFVHVTENLCDDCWSILLISSEGFVDTVAAQGDSPWEADDPCCRGVRGSELRR